MRILTVLLIFLFTTPAAFADSCVARLTGVAITREHVGDRLCSIDFHVGGPTDFRAWARLNGDTLSFYIYTRNEDRRSDVLYGRDVIRIALDEYGDRVRTIKAIWYSGDNLEAYDAAIANGVPKRRAAAATWTGRTLARFGFTSVGSVTRVRPDDRPEYVTCLFRRPFSERWRRWWAS